MRILIFANPFYPSIGGIETFSRLMAQELLRRGHAVKLITPTTSAEVDTFPYQVSRNPSPMELIRLVRWADVYWQNHVSLKYLWPILFWRKPWLVTVHSYFWKGYLKETLKRFVVGMGQCVAVSEALAESLLNKPTVIVNPYDESVFYTKDLTRTKNLIYVGRLYKNKGIGILLNALAQLRNERCHLTLTIVGQGPDEGNLLRQVKDLELDKQVTFAGVLKGEMLADILNEHEVLVIPSLDPEPLPLVVLEAIACGCVVVGSDKGGISQAIGPCGITFEAGSVEKLKESLDSLYRNPEQMRQMRGSAAGHLKQYGKNEIVDQYESLFKKLTRVR